MTIEIANRLVKLRKEKGLSQEELADKLGLSRQAVSKWERAEASPDTDNLICLAKLYGVSLDDLLNTEDDLDTIVEEQVKQEDSGKTENNSSNEDNKEDKTEESASQKKGIHLQDDEGNTIDIDAKGIHLKENNGHKMEVNKPKIIEEKSPLVKFADVLEGCLFISATIAYLLLGFFVKPWGWYGGWVVFFIPEMICSLLRAIDKKEFRQLNVPFYTMFAFFFVCLIAPGVSAVLWHPMWVVFLLIPLYYTALSPIDEFNKRRREAKCKCGEVHNCCYDNDEVSKD